MQTVNIKHKELGTIALENITEIHYLYPTPMGRRIAFESSRDCTGYTYDVDDVLEFEAVEQSDAEIAELRKALKLWIKYARTNSASDGMTALSETRKVMPNEVAAENRLNKQAVQS